MSSAVLGIILGTTTGIVGPFYEYNAHADGAVTFYGDLLHKWGVYYLVVLIVGLFMWAQGMITTDSVTVIAAAFAAHGVTAYLVASIIIPLVDGFGLVSFIGQAVDAVKGGPDE